MRSSIHRHDSANAANRDHSPYCSMATALLAFSVLVTSTEAAETWKTHVVHDGAHCNTSVGADFTGDGLPDVICNDGGVTRLLVAPDWTEVVLDAERKLGLIHSEVMDVDNDGDFDFVGTRYRPGLIFWLECPNEPLTERWAYHSIDDKVIGIHGLLVGDVDKDGSPDLLANSAQPDGPFANSLVWYSTPPSPAAAESWPRHIVANGDAPGLSHYLGLGDVNGDGRPDVASGAKGGPTDEAGLGNWFAWWEAPATAGKRWKKHLISDQQPGATNIHPADVNGDGRTDFVASRGHGQGVVWFEGPGWREHPIDSEITGPHCLAVTDLDGDGDVDAATCAKDDKLAAWYENDGNGGFKKHVVATNQAAYDIRAIDMDRDGDLDLLIAGQASKNVVWCENPIK